MHIAHVTFMHLQLLTLESLHTWSKTAKDKTQKN